MTIYEMQEMPSQIAWRHFSQREQVTIKPFYNSCRWIRRQQTCGMIHWLWLLTREVSQWPMNHLCTMSTANNDQQVQTQSIYISGKNLHIRHTHCSLCNLFNIWWIGRLNIMIIAMISSCKHSIHKTVIHLLLIQRDTEEDTRVIFWNSSKNQCLPIVG